ncbi:MAG: GNAT family N-acetyltransferase [Bacteroidia bacterium]
MAELEDIVIKPCDDKDFDEVKEYVREMCLDDREMKHYQFLVAKKDEEILGFGRLREYEDSVELCSLGVIEKYRGKGIGKKLVWSLIDNFYQKSDFNRKNLYVVTIIPEYFLKFGFRMVEDNCPLSIMKKYEYCTNVLSVPEKYVVMRLDIDKKDFAQNFYQ